MLAAKRRHTATATQDHILLKYPGRSRRLEPNMTRSGDSALGTCPATLSHLVGLFGIDVEDISRAATKKGGQIARVTPGKTGAPPVDHLLAMYDRLEWTSAIKLHFRGIRASLKHQFAARSDMCASLHPWVPAVTPKSRGVHCKGLGLIKSELPAVRLAACPKRQSRYVRSQIFYAHE